MQFCCCMVVSTAAWSERGNVFISTENSILIVLIIMVMKYHWQLLLVVTFTGPSRLLKHKIDISDNMSQARWYSQIRIISWPTLLFTVFSPSPILRNLMKTHFENRAKLVAGTFNTSIWKWRFNPPQPPPPKKILCNNGP